MAIGDGNSMLEAALGAAGLHSQNDQSSPPSWGSPDDTSVDNDTLLTNTTGSDTDLGSSAFPLVNGRY